MKTNQKSRMMKSWVKRMRKVFTSVMVTGLLIVGLPEAGGQVLKGIVHPDLTYSTWNGRVIRVGTAAGIKPFAYTNEQGVVEGFSVDLMRESLARMGCEAEFVVGKVDELVAQLEAGEIDTVNMLVRNPQRREKFSFTFPYLSLHAAMVVRKDSPEFHSLNDMQDKRVGILSGGVMEAYFQNNQFPIELDKSQSFRWSLEKLVSGELGAVIMERTAARGLLKERRFSNLHVVLEPVDMIPQGFCFAVRKDNRDLLALLNDGLSFVGVEGMHRRIYAKWFPNLLSCDQRYVIMGGHSEYAPFEYTNELGDPEGFAVDLSRAIATVMNFDVDIQLFRSANIFEPLDTRQVDALQSVFYSQKRAEKYDFLLPHARENFFFVLPAGMEKEPESLEDAKNLRIMIAERDIVSEWLEELNYTNNIEYTESVYGVLDAITNDRADCGILPRVVAEQLIAQKHLPIKIGKTPIFVGDLCMVVPKGDEALLARLTEGVRILKDSGEYRLIQKKWLLTPEHENPFWGWVIKHSFWIALGLLLIIISVLSWITILNVMVRNRTQQLQDNEVFYRMVLDNLPVGIGVTYIDRPQEWTYMNDLFPVVFRTSRKGLLEADNFFYEVYKDDLEQAKFRYEECLQKYTQTTDMHFRWDEVPVFRKGKETHYISVQTVRFPKNNQIISIAWDETEKVERRQLAEQYTDVIRVMSSVSRVITHATERQAMLFEICQTLMNVRGCMISWIGLMETDAQGNSQLKTVAHAGDPAHIVEIGDTLIEEGFIPPCVEAARQKGFPMECGGDRPICQTCPLYEHHRNMTSLVCTLTHHEHHYGVIGISFPKGMVNPEEESKLFMELSGEIAFAIYSLDQAELRRKAQSELVQKNRELARSEQMLRSIFDVATDGVVLTDLKEERYVLSNRAFREMIGVSSEQLPTVHVKDVHPAGEMVRIHKLFQDQFGNKPVAHSAVPMLRQDGTLFYADISSSPINIEGQELVVSVFRDITERLALQERMNQTHRLESVGRLAGGIAHDFNNLLMGVMGYVELAMMELTPEHPVYADLQEVMNHAKRSSQLTRQLLAFARKQPISPKFMDLSKTIESMVPLLKRIIGEGVKMEWHPYDEGTTVWMDASQVDQILTNLCVNARDAMKGEGTIRVCVWVTQLDEKTLKRYSNIEPGRYVCLEVSDTGCGISHEQMNHIFEPFYTTKSMGKGTGLGLATIHGIIAQNRGFIRAESELGKGSAFYCYLPYREPQEDEKVKASETQKINLERGHESIILVEDDAMIRVGVDRYLSGLGYCVTSFENPRFALVQTESLKEHVPLLITDLVMPEMDGQSLAIELRKRWPQIRVLYMSGYTDKEIRTENMGPHDVFMHKPFAMPDMAAKVREILDA